MKRKAGALFLILVFLTMEFQAFSQTKDNGLSVDELNEYKEKVRHLVSFLEFAINTVGDDETTTKEKDIIINQSFLKVFRDEKVIIEDDLDENREIVANKEVQAYLKDVDFFFRKVAFKFDIEQIEYLANDDGRNYFKVAMNRVLNGVTVNQDTVKSVKKRYIEINLNEGEQDLKIASIYTTRLSEKEEMVNWWENLSNEWRLIFKKEIGAYDTVGLELIRQAANIERIDISGNKYIDDLEGLGQLHNLKELNISNTMIDNLLPLRNLTKLKSLDFSKTMVGDLEPLKYNIKLEELYGSNSQVESVVFLENLESLKTLHLGGNMLYDISALSALTNLRSLDISDTRVSELDALDSLYFLSDLTIAGTVVSTLKPLENLDSLLSIDFTGSNVRSVEPLKGLPKLEIVICNNTPVSGIDALSDMPALKRIYCDNTLITRSQANQFMAMNPRALVIFKSDLLRNWWSNLNETWKGIFIKQVGVGLEPNKEELAEIAKITEINLSGVESIESLQPAAILENLKSIDLSNTGVNDLSPLRELDKLEHIDCSFNPVTSLEALSYLRNLKVLNIEKTNVTNLEPLNYHENLEILYCDDAPIDPKEILAYTERHPSMLAVYKTDSLVSWWNSLDNEWIGIFSKRLTMDDVSASASEYKPGKPAAGDIPSSEDLHRIANLQILSIQNNAFIDNLEPLMQLQNLKSLQVVNTRVSNLSPLANLTKMRSLDISYNPVSDLSPLTNLGWLVNLNIANTPVDDLTPISGLNHIEELDCSGSQVKNLSPLSRLYKLKTLNCSNTRVRSLKPVEDHSDLASLSCFNTWISSRKIDKFMKDHPDTVVRFY